MKTKDKQTILNSFKNGPIKYTFKIQVSLDKKHLDERKEMDTSRDLFKEAIDEAISEFQSQMLDALCWSELSDDDDCDWKHVATHMNVKIK